MLIDGEKFACEACVRGHRVSNCQHSDRPLQHINKKGRPVSQCAHCRAMRKSRSAHVKCDCGIKPNKCIHLQPRVNGHSHTCCYNHGGVCTCACSSDGSASTTTRDVGYKPGPRARRATTAHSPPRSVIAKHAHQQKSILRSRSSTAQSRASPLAINRSRSAGSLQGLSAIHHQDAASGDTTPDNLTENGSPPPGDPTGASLSGHPFAPLELSRAATFPPPYVQNVGYDLVNMGSGFSDNEGPLYSAGLATPSSMWGVGEPFMPPSYNSMPRSNQMFDFDFAMAPDSYSEQSSDQLPNLAAASSGEVSETDENHSPPHALEPVDFLQDQADYDGMMPRPEIFDDAPLLYTFDEEFQALGYSEGGYSAEKAPEYGFWAPSP